MYPDLGPLINFISSILILLFLVATSIIAIVVIITVLGAAIRELLNHLHGSV